MASSGVREQVGRIGTLPIRLADLPRPYRHIIADSVEIRRDIAGTDTRAEAQRSTVREWKLDDWTGGFGNPTWRPDQANVYNTSANVCPDFRSADLRGAPLVLGPLAATAQQSGGGQFAPVAPGYLALATNSAETQLTVYGSNADAVVNAWDESAGTFSAGGNPAGAAFDFRGMTDPSDGYVYVVLSQGDIYKVNLGTSNTLHCDVSAMASPKWNTANPAVVSYRGEVYVLSAQGDVYRIDRSSTNTATQVVDAYYTSIPYQLNAAESNPTRRVAATDVGIVWAQPTAHSVDIWEYNVGEDSSSIVAQLPAGAFVHSMLFVSGFVFVGYSHVFATAAGPSGYVHYFRGGQSGTIGPFSPNANVARVNLAGVYGGRYVVVVLGTRNNLATTTFPTQVLAYDLKEGATHNWSQGVATVSNSNIGVSALLLGDRVFASTRDSGGTYEIDLFTLDEYSTVAAGSAYLDTGRYDFDLPGTLKLLTDVTVTFDPLPANTSIQIQYSLDGGAWQDNGMDITTDGLTNVTFQVASQNDTFYELELRILLNSTSSTATPSVRSVTARALPVSVQEYWDLSISLNPQNYDTAFGSDFIHPDHIVSELRDLKTDKVTVSFTNPWEVDMSANDAAQTETVIVQTVDTPDIGGDEAGRYARVRLMKATLS